MAVELAHRRRTNENHSGMTVTSDADAVAKQARRCFRKRDYAQAMELFEKALELDERRPEVHMGMATASFLAQDFDKAIHHFNRVTHLKPADGRPLINLGAVYNQMGDYQKAVGVLRRGLAKEKNSAEGFYNLGYAHRKLEQASMAISAYREAVRINPDMIEAHVNLANVYLDMKNYQQSILHYNKALEINPEFESAKRGLATAQHTSAEAKKAVSPFGRLVEHGKLKPKAQAGSQRELTDAERIEDRAKLHDLSNEIDVTAKQFLTHLLETLDKRLSTLDRAVAQESEAPSALVNAYEEFAQAVADSAELRRTFKRKLLELRSHEELINAPKVPGLKGS